MGVRTEVQGDARARLGPLALLDTLLWVTEIPRCFALSRVVKSYAGYLSLSKLIVPAFCSQG